MEGIRLMKTIAFFDAKPYDRESFDRANRHYSIRYEDCRLTAQTAPLAVGCEAVCAFVNDEIGRGRLRVVRVPAYSPHAVAEHAMGLLLAVNRKLHRAYARTRDFNFSIAGLMGIDLYGKTLGVIGTGKIGRAMMDIGRGFGMRVIAYDPYPAPGARIEYVPLPRLLAESEAISLH